LRWPQVTSWIQWSAAWEDEKHLTTKKELVDQIYRKLKLLEDIGEKCYKDNNKNWKTEIEKISGLKSDSVNWIGDKRLENFFRHQACGKKECPHLQERILLGNAGAS
jgi:hypothetical protein